MPANLPPEYYKLQEEYSYVKDKKCRIKILKEMLSVIPKHKGSEKVIGEIRRRISILKKEIELEKRKKRKIKGIRKEGAAQVCLVGLPNSGKSFILNKLCNKNIQSTEIAFETKNPEVGMLDIDGVKIQLIEIPSIYHGFFEKRKDVKTLLLSCDLICFLVNKKEELNLLKSEIDVEKPFIVANSKNLNLFKRKVWEKLGLIKVYTKEPGKQAEKTPIALKNGATVKDLGNKIHKDFIKKFKFAKIYRKIGKVKEIKVGLNFTLNDGDIVEFHIK